MENIKGGMVPTANSFSPAHYATIARPDGAGFFCPSFSFITERGTKLTFDKRYNYYGDIILASDWNRAGFMTI